MTSSPFESPRLTRILVGILVLKITLFAFIAFQRPQALYPPDASSYITPAAELVRHGTFTDHGRPVLFRTPGYSLLLAPIVAGFGTDHAHLVVIIQFLLSFITAAMMFSCTRGLHGGRSIATFALLIALVDPTILAGEFSVATETLYTTLLTAAVCAVAWYARTRKAATLPASLTAITLATFVRPVALYLGTLAAAFLATETIRQRQWKHLALVALGLTINLGAIHAWEVRNERLFGEPVFVSVKGRNLYAYNAAAVRALAEGRSYREVQAAHLADRVSDNPAVQARYEEARGLRILAAHPVATLAVTLKGLAVNLFEPGTGFFLNLLGLRQSGSGIIYKFQSMPFVSFLRYLVQHELPLLVATVVGMGYLLVFWSLVFLGSASVFRTSSLVFWMVVGTVAYHLVLSAGPASTFRFRTPVVPLLALLAAFGWGRVLAWEEQRRS